MQPVPESQRLPDCEHYEPCGNAYVCEKRSLSFGRADERAYEVRKKDREFVKDSEAYWRMRKEGKQPRGIDKSAMAEALATHPIELEIGRSLHPSERKALVRMNGTI